MRRVDRLERVVLRLQADPPVLAEEPLDRRLVGNLVFARQRRDDVAVARILLAPHDDVVPVEDPGVDHRVAAHPEDELLAAPSQWLGNAYIALDRLLCKQ